MQTPAAFFWAHIKTVACVGGAFLRALGKNDRAGGGIVDGKGAKLWEDRFYPIDNVRYTLQMSIASSLPVHTDHPTNGPPVAPVLFECDPVGNMESRTVDGVSYALIYDSENRLSSVVGGGATVTFTYDGDGNKVKKDENGIVTHYPGRHYEATKDSGSTKYFFADSQLVSFERSPDYGVDNGRRYVFRDHLGSTSVIVNGRGEKLWEDRCKIAASRIDPAPF